MCRAVAAGKQHPQPTWLSCPCGHVRKATATVYLEFIPCITPLPRKSLLRHFDKSLEKQRELTVVVHFSITGSANKRKTLQKYFTAEATVIREII